MKIYRAADCGMHACSAQFFGGNFLSNRSLHQCRTSQKKAATIRHKNVVVHHRKVSAASNAHAHDGRDLRNPHRGHDGIVAKDPPEVVSVGKDVFL